MARVLYRPRGLRCVAEVRRLTIGVMAQAIELRDGGGLDYRMIALRLGVSDAALAEAFAQAEMFGFRGLSGDSDSNRCSGGARRRLHIA